MIRSVFWRPLDEIGLEHLLFELSADAIRADGAILQTRQGQAFRARYRIEAGPDWSMRACDIEVEGTERRLALRLDGAGRWREEAAGAPLSALAGCREVDIQISPFTNSLPIGRLSLALGQSAEILAAYIAVPELSVVPAPQRYTRLAASLYRYEGLGTGFTAELPVDADGLVVDYPGVFARAAHPIAT